MLVLFVVMVFAGVYVARNGNPFPVVPRPISFSAQEVYGGRVDLEFGYRGRPVLLVFLDNVVSHLPARGFPCSAN